jgi:patatin-related protein
MSDYASLPRPEFRRELRLGLVVYGGVSLAIYMNGICQEFYHAVRGRGIYKLMKALVDADVVVDTISGTSSGGINGILLGYALANSNDRELINFSTFSNIWRSSEKILQLLHQPDLFQIRAIEQPFDGEGFYQKELVNAFDRVTANKLPRPQHEWFSNFNELDLFITATDYHGKVIRRLDGTGAVVDEKSHSTLFHLKHRLGRKEDFNPHYREPNLPRTDRDTYQSFAKLCRLTSAIPLLFTPVVVDAQTANNLVDRQLLAWGNLSPRYLTDRATTDGSNFYFLDGGLLSNAPISIATKEMYYRPSDRVKERKFFYIDANPGYFTNIEQFSLSKKPSVGNILHSTVCYEPIYQSLNNDLRAIAEHNRKIRRNHSMLESLEASVNLGQFSAKSTPPVEGIYLQTRLINIQNRCLPLLLQLERGDNPRLYPEAIDKIAIALQDTVYRPHKKQKKLKKILRRFAPQLINLDVDYSLRKHFYIVEKIAKYLNQTRDRDTQKKLIDLTKQLNCNIQLLEVVRASLELLLGDPAIGNYFYYLVQREQDNRRLRALIYELIFRLHRFLLDGTRLDTVYLRDSAGINIGTIAPHFWLDLPDRAEIFTEDTWLSAQEITGAFTQLKHRISSLQHTSDLHRLLWMDRLLEYDGENNDTFPSLLKPINIAAEALIERSKNPYTETLLQQWRRFNYLDRELYPFEYLNNLESKEIIETIKISPDEAQLGLGTGKSFAEKIAADKLYSMGGLFKKSWRSNDLLWGRLDGLNRLLEGIITPESVQNFATLIERETARNNCTTAAYLDWLVTESLPQLTGAEREKIRQHLDRLAQPNRAIEHQELQTILNDLILAGHQEILANDIHYVLEGMGTHPNRWESPVQGASARDLLLQHRMGSQSVNLYSLDRAWARAPEDDRAIVRPKAIHRIEQQSLTELATQQANFFRHQYRVMADKIWVNVTLRTIFSSSMRIVLFLRDFLVSTMGKFNRNRLALNPFYRWLDGTLQSLYDWLQGGNIKLASVHTRPRLFLLQSVGLGIAGAGIFMGLLSSPLWLLLAIPGLTSWWFLQTVRLKRLTAARKRPFLPQAKE